MLLKETSLYDRVTQSLSHKNLLSQKKNIFTNYKVTIVVKKLLTNKCFNKVGFSN